MSDFKIYCRRCLRSIYLISGLDPERSLFSDNKSGFFINPRDYLSDK